jgi:general secretion pathway protein D
MKKIILILAFFTFNYIVTAQIDLQKTLSGAYNPEELVTLSENLPFNTAVEILSKISEKLTGRKIVLTLEYTKPIGIALTKMQYKKALLTIVQYHGLFYEETPEAIFVKKDEQKVEKPATINYAPVDSRDVKISAVFFEANVSEMRERGINWQTLLSKQGFSVGTGLTSFATSTQTTTSDFNVNAEGDFNAGSFTGTASSVFKFFESENLGEIIASPSITVRDQQKGRIQIGSDISVKQKDFAGNVVEQFFSTGTIIEVSPFIYNEDGIDYILLQLDVERSSALADVERPEIRKTKATTQVLMLDGEETAIGGLFINEETNIRKGIPFLKDLPWWVLGLRYLTGYDSKEVVKKEVIILVKIEINQSLRDRVVNKNEVLKEQILKNKKRLEELKLNIPKKTGDEE